MSDKWFKGSTNMINHQQVLLRISDWDNVHKLSIVTTKGTTPEVAIMGPEGVNRETVTPIKTARELQDYLKRYLGG